MFGIVLQRLALQLILDIALFPVWWYTEGLRRVCIGLWHNLQDTNLRLAPGLWLKNIFTPMYGQRDFQGRIMSFFMRIVNVIGRSVALLFWCIVLLCLLVAWLVVPVSLVFMMFHIYSKQ